MQVTKKVALIVSLSLLVEDFEQSIKSNEPIKIKNNIPNDFRREIKLSCFIIRVYWCPVNL
ncbi:hypothetical protein [Chryseobacterium pyrolae]|uniref:hypothetical protein n=1 Tax=Chryseobacterium pyrolae TaxID=2987481 RepID=UPI0021E7A3E0|nr:hypothetical protein [Chryseobacterium pyrolae]